MPTYCNLYSDEDLPFFYRYETVDFPLKVNVKGILVGYSEVIVSLVQTNHIIHKFKKDLVIDEENDLIVLSLTQDDTGLFNKGLVKLQVNIKYDTSEERDTSLMAYIEVRENLYKEVM